MKKRIFNINRYCDNYQNKYGMLCDTGEDAKIFCNYLNSIGREWFSTESYADLTYWEGTPIIYYFNRGTASNVDEYQNNSAIILNFNDFDWSLFSPEKSEITFSLRDLKDNYIIEVRSGEKYIKIGDYFINCKRAHPVYLYKNSLKHSLDENKDIMKVYEINTCLDDTINLDTLLLEKCSEKNYLKCVWGIEKETSYVSLTIDMLEDYFGHKIKILEE